MSGTLILLAKAGYEIHYFNIANGCCGSMSLSRADTAHTRLKESQAAAAGIPAAFHPPVCDDMSIFYDHSTLARVGCVVRRVNPTIVLDTCAYRLHGRPPKHMSIGSLRILRQKYAEFSV